MLHLGDITHISGNTAPIVDCIIGGSPCQDLSIAGKRAGLDGERSGLYMEQIRIVKEMRDRDERNGRTGVDIRPRYMVWENVPGAFSSNKGEDFRIVLEEIAKVCDKDAVIPMPDQGKWTNCGCILGDGWSAAWRVLDAQFWGVPQRRRRIALVADFGGHSAFEILLVRKSLSGYSDESKPKRKEASTDASRGFGADDSEFITFEPGIASREGGHIYEGVSGTLRAKAGDNQMSTAYTLRERAGCAGGGKGALIQIDTHDGAPTVCYHAFPKFNYSQFRASDTELATLKAKGGTCGDGSETLVVSVDCRNGTENEVNGALQSNSAHSLNGNNVVRTRYIVRRLTPLECERLQGYPDGWTDIGEWTDTNGKKRQTSDAARYKALGNSIALPPWKWVLKRICACYERDATMASLFDGIGGFPYLWEQLNGKGTCLWASEIEEFPIAVTKARIGE